MMQHDAALILTYFRHEPAPEPGFIVDRLGVRTRSSLLWDGVQHLDGTVLGPPLICDFHAEAIEWVGLLKAAGGASGQYVAMELGAGWAPWLVAGAHVARTRGITDIRLLGVEADPGHFAAMRQHLIDNAFDPDRHVLLHGAVGAVGGHACWPSVADPRNEWGLAPAEDGGEDYLGRHFTDTIDVEIFAIAGLLEREPVWDLVHIDVQGGEVDLCQAIVIMLQERVRRLVIGTHSRVIDGALIALLQPRGWVLENEKPARMTFAAGAPTLEAMTTHDGTQVWRNLRFG